MAVKTYNGHKGMQDSMLQDLNRLPSFRFLISSYAVAAAFTLSVLPPCDSKTPPQVFCCKPAVC